MLIIARQGEPGACYTHIFSSFFLSFSIASLKLTTDLPGVIANSEIACKESNRALRTSRYTYCQLSIIRQTFREISSSNMSNVRCGFI